LEIDRDINGARNIYLKNIGLDESLYTLEDLK
jgi:transposase